MKEYEDAQNKAIDKSSRFSWRVQTRNEYYDGGRLNKTVSEIIESVPPNKHKTSTKTIIDDKTIFVEVIDIDDKSYIKENDGEWKIKIPNESYGIGENGDEENSKQTEKYTAKSVNYNGKIVRYYEKIISFTGNSSEQSYYSKTRTWISKAGLLLKEENENGLSEQNISKHQVEIYNYNAKIQIEAPIIETSRQK